MIGTTTQDGDYPAFVFTRNPEIAAEYSQEAQRRRGTEPEQVYINPSYLRTENPATFDAGGANLAEVREAINESIAAAREAGHDSIVVQNIVADIGPVSNQEQEMVMVFDPDQIRPADSAFLTRSDYRPGQLNAFPPAVEAAQRYAERAGIDYHPPETFADIDPEFAQRVAHEFEVMQHDPSNPEVKAAYDAMIEETVAQWHAMMETGLEVEFIAGTDPYASPKDAILDVVNNNHLWVYPTRAGFGSDQSFDPVDNPLLRETDIEISGQKALANDIFRAVHDYFGHIKPGVMFRWTGEENAWQSHASMYSPIARRALTTETRGQNLWLNFGPHGEHNRTASGADTIYADQKIGLLPRWVSETNRISGHERYEAVVRENQRGLAGAVSGRGEIELVHYSSRPFDRTDPGRYGTGLSGSTRAEKNRSYDPGFVKRTYFGIESAVQNGYRKEQGLGSIRKVARLDAGLLYPVDADPLGLWGADPTTGEKNIADAGFSGYWVNHPALGKVAAVFDPLEVAAPAALNQGPLDTLSAAFRRWFKDSQVVDANGEPLVVYHGTSESEDFLELDARAGELGAHFGTAQQASEVAEHKVVPYDYYNRRRSAPRVMPAYLSIQSPLRLMDQGGFDSTTVPSQLADLGLMSAAEADRIRDGVEQGWLTETEATHRLQEVIKSHGYDGVVYLNRREAVPRDAWGDDGMSDAEYAAISPAASDSYIVFDPGQIKSAVGNRGTYDRNDPNVLHQTAVPAAEYPGQRVLIMQSGTSEGFEVRIGILKQVPDR